MLEKCEKNGSGEDYLILYVKLDMAKNGNFNNTGNTSVYKHILQTITTWGTMIRKQQC